MVKKEQKAMSFFNGKWKAVEIIGEGSYGKVYKAVKEEFQIKSYSAIKQIKIPYSKNEITTLRTEGMTDVDIGKYYEKSVKKWLDEIKFMSAFKDSENIVHIEDYEIVKKSKEIGWTINIRMELLKSLDKYTLENKITDKTILKMAIDIASALEDCEEKNVIHRDIKPENIFVNSKGVFKIGDFGIAKQIDKTISNLSKKGTENYMAPELYKNERGNRTVDIYSLGIMLYRYFNFNRLPFYPDYPNEITMDSREEALYKRINQEKISPPRNASREIAEIILKCCNYYSKDRYQSAQILKEDLKKEYDKITEPKVLFKYEEKEEQSNDVHNGTISIYGNEKPIEDEEEIFIEDDELEEECDNSNDINVENEDYVEHISVKKEHKFKLKKLLLIMIVFIIISSLGLIGFLGIYSYMYTDFRKEDVHSVYGKYINYECEDIPSNIKWKILYIDDENIYLIASKNVSKDVSLENEIDNNSLENIKDEKVLKYLDFKTKYPSSDFNNTKVLSYLVDTKKWEKYCNETYSDFAIGAPTIDMLIKSYNKVNEDKLVYEINEKGYKVKFEADLEYSSEPLNLMDLVYLNSNKTQYEDLFNYSDDNTVNKNEVAWIAGNSGYDENSLYQLSSKLSPTNNYKTEAGIRPVICLKSGVRFKQKNDGTYDIIYNNWTKLLDKFRKKDESKENAQNITDVSYEEITKGDLKFNLPSVFKPDTEDGYMYNDIYNLRIIQKNVFESYNTINEFLTQSFTKSNEQYELKSSDIKTEEINGTKWSKIEVESKGKSEKYGGHFKSYYFATERNEKYYCIEFKVNYVEEKAEWPECFEIIKKSLNFNI